MLEGFIGELNRVVVCIRFMNDGVWADLYGKIDVRKNERDVIESIEGVIIECMDKILEHCNRIKPVHITSVVLSNEMCRFSDKIRKLSIKISKKIPEQFAKVTLTEYKPSSKLIRFFKKVCNEGKIDAQVTLHSETELSTDDEEDDDKKTILKPPLMKAILKDRDNDPIITSENKIEIKTHFEQRSINKPKNTSNQCAESIRMNYDELKKSHKSWFIIVDEIHQKKRLMEKRDNCEYKVVYSEMFPIVFYYKKTTQHKVPFII